MHRKLLLTALLTSFASSSAFAEGQTVDGAYVDDLGKQVARIAAFAESDGASDASTATELGGPFALAEDLGAPLTPKSSFPKKQGTQSAESGARVGSVDVNFVLAQLSMQLGANYHLQLHQALPADDTTALFLQNGRITMAELAAQAEKIAPGAIEVSGTTYTSHKPIVVWSNAELQIGPGETLKLDESTGSFLMNTGTLRIQQAKITSLGKPNTRHEQFRPFIITALAGSFEAESSEFVGLGFGDFAAMEGVAIIASPLFRSQKPSHISGSRFEDVGSLALRYTSDAAVRANTFFEMNGPAVELVNVDRADIGANLVVGSEHHGISIKGRSREITLRDNAVLNGKGAGIVAANGVESLSIERNLIAGNANGGAALLRMNCSTLSENVFFDNKQFGTRIRQSVGASFTGNRYVGNLGPALAITEQPGNAESALTGNLFYSNRSGVYGASARSMALKNNDFRQQLPIILDGELAEYVPDLMRASAGPNDTPLTIGTKATATAAAYPAVAPAAVGACAQGGNG